MSAPSPGEHNLVVLAEQSPREVLILDAVPVTSVGTTDRKAVRSMARTAEGES